MKTHVLFYLLSLSSAVFSQQTVGEIYQRMSVLPWMNGIKMYSTSTGLTYFNEYGFDLTKDSLNDMELTIASDANALISSASVVLKSFNGFKIHKDTSYVESFQYVNNMGQAVDTTRKTQIVKKYHDNDTLFYDVVHSTSGIITNYYQKNSPVVIFNNVLPFVQDTCYIVLEKSYYYTILKVWLQYSTKVQILEARTNAPLAYFQPLFCYPNPSTNSVRFIGNIEKIKAFSADGKLVYQGYETSANPEINLENFAKGVYLFSCFVDNEWRQIKVVKKD